jgi:hypothetical protein
MSLSRYLLSAAIFASFCLSLTAGTKELDGKYTPDQVKSACDKVGGEYFPQGTSGTYGCENHKNGSMVLCNRDNKCEGYTQTRTTKDNRKIIRDLELDAYAPVKKQASRD